MMRKDLPPYEDYSGPVDSPNKYVDYCIYQGRQLGKTHKLIMSIPNRPIVIVVWRHDWGREMVRMLKQHRPDYDISNITFIRYDDIRADNIPKILRGKNKVPIYVDNAVLDMVQAEFVRDLNRKYGEDNELQQLREKIKRLEAELGRYRAKEDFLRGWYEAFSIQRKKDFDRDRGDD